MLKNNAMLSLAGILLPLLTTLPCVADSPLIVAATANTRRPTREALACSPYIESSAVLPQGTAFAELDYGVINGVCPSAGHVCDITTYTCPIKPITYGPPASFDVAVLDNAGNVLFQTTQAPANDVYPVDSLGNPIPPIHVGHWNYYSVTLDVHTLTATSPATIYLELTRCFDDSAAVCGPPEAQATIRPTQPAPSFVFDINALAIADPAQTQLLIQKYRAEDTYFSVLQRTTPAGTPDPVPPGTLPPSRPQMNVTGAVVVPLAGSNQVWFKLLDPRDPSDYAAIDAHDGDNRDKSPGAIMLSDGTARTTVGNVLTATPDASGKVSLVLEGTDRYAGDNYQVEASFDQAFSCETPGTRLYPCARSAIITAWKRAYIEVQKMYRVSSYLADAITEVPKSVTTPAHYIITVDDVKPFQGITTPFTVRLMHGRRFDDPTKPPWDEVVQITNVTATESLGFLKKHVRGVLAAAPTWTPAHAYSFSQETVLGATRRYTADAVALEQPSRTSSYLLPRHTQLTDELYKRAFVDYIWLSDADQSDVDSYPGQSVIPYAGRVPHVEDITYQDEQIISAKWSANIALDYDIHGQTRDNHFTLFVADKPAPFPGVTEWGETLTATASTGHRRFSFVYAGLMDGGPADWIAGITTHELSHQWHVNEYPPHPTGFEGGHCGQPGTPNPLGAPIPPPMPPESANGHLCVMFADGSDPSFKDGVIVFHYDHLGGNVSSEFRDIRDQTEPVSTEKPTP